MSNQLPYRVEYAKSSRASCQYCKASIAKESLRIAAIIQSPFHDGTIPKWYHSTCFFFKQRPESSTDIADFDNIRWEDQQEIKKQIEETKNTAPPVAKGKKRGSSAKTNANTSSTLFHVEYAKSGKSTCKGCDQKIVKDEIRVSRKDFESDEGRRYGGLDRWHHLECFAKLRVALGYLESGNDMPGLKSLSKEDQKTVINALPKHEDGAPLIKKVKQELEDMEEEEKLKKQNKEIFSVRDTLSNLSKSELLELLKKNKQQIPEGISTMLDRLADAVCFGALEPCPQCSGQLVYSSGMGYKCTGDLTEWTKCEYVTQDPKRKKFVLPIEIKDNHSLNFKCKVKKRHVKITMPSTSTVIKKEGSTSTGPKVQGKPQPLQHCQFVILGHTEKDKDLLKKEIQLLGGTVTTKIHENLTAVISNQKEVEKMGKKMAELKNLEIPVISEDFVEEAKEWTDVPLVLLKNKTISSWSGDINGKISAITAKSNAAKSKSKFEKSGVVKVCVKGGLAVDPDSGLDDCAHVYQRGKDKFTAVLGITDIQSKKNSFYKLQILKHDVSNKYWLFRSWGRIGTTIGGNKLENLSLEECISSFENLYEEKSGNTWSNRDNFVKVPHKMYPIDVSHADDDEMLNSLESNIESKLEKPIQELIKLIFDAQKMKKVMAEFEIDLEKMPLGKISKSQIQKAYSVLTELQDLIKDENVNRVSLIDASNRFYTLIPHSFGLLEPKILESMEEIQTKCEMLDALLEMEIAYHLLHIEKDNKKHPLDSHYEQLKTNITVLNKESEEYKIINQYVKNTHAATHSFYELEIEDVFIVSRDGEDQRFKPFKKLSNRKLLWHGSRTTNYAGILSQGLRIAPPEAPVTGYMFGKGIYFADMVSKSANYCCTNSQNTTGLLLLCEVALGNMYERYAADYIEKLPKGKHSTKGCGQTEPDPEVVYKLHDDIEVPYGPPVSVKAEKNRSLLYNEYIVYDVAQVKVRYLLKTKFKYKTQ